MNILLIVGRIAFVVIFVLSGAQKLINIAGTAAAIESKIVIPAALSGIVAQIEAATGMSAPQLLAIAAGALEVIAGLMIAVNIGIRVATILLIAFTIVTTFLFHDFWNMVGPDRAANMIQALKNLSIVGALLILFVIGSWQPRPEYRDLPRQRY